MKKKRHPAGNYEMQLTCPWTSNPTAYGAANPHTLAIALVNPNSVPA